MFVTSVKKSYFLNNYTLIKYKMQQLPKFSIYIVKYIRYIRIFLIIYTKASLCYNRIIDNNKEERRWNQSESVFISFVKNVD